MSMYDGVKELKITEVKLPLRPFKAEVWFPEKLTLEEVETIKKVGDGLLEEMFRYITSMGASFVRQSPNSRIMKDFGTEQLGIKWRFQLALDTTQPPSITKVPDTGYEYLIVRPDK